MKPKFFSSLIALYIVYYNTLYIRLLKHIMYKKKYHILFTCCQYNITIFIQCTYHSSFFFSSSSEEKWFVKKKRIIPYLLTLSTLFWSKEKRSSAIRLEKNMYFSYNVIYRYIIYNIHTFTQTTE